MNREEVNQILKGVVWDYDIDPYELYLVTIDQKPSFGFFTKENILLRFLERLTWYELQSLYDKEYFKKDITAALLNRLKNKQIRQKYEFILKILRGEAVSFSGWDTEKDTASPRKILSINSYFCLICLFFKRFSNAAVIFFLKYSLSYNDCSSYHVKRSKNLNSIFSLVKNPKEGF